MRSLPARRCDQIAALFLMLATLFRFWYAGRHDLLEDESYYWQWSRHLAAGYYDNTPAMAYVIRFFTAIFGTDEIGVRAGAIVSGLAASIFLYLLAKRIVGPPIALLAVVIANIIPLFAVGAVIMTQDPVQLAFWSATLYVAWLAVAPTPSPSPADAGEGDRSARGAWLWILAGVLAGLTAMSKLNGLLVLPCVLLYVCMAPSARRWLAHPAPYIAAAIALALFAPFVWWNHTHGNAFWIHIHAMGTRGDNGFTLQWMGEFLGAQAILISPLLFLTYLATLVRPGASGPLAPTPNPSPADAGEGSSLLAPTKREADAGTAPGPSSEFGRGADEGRGEGHPFMPAGQEAGRSAAWEGLLYLWCGSVVVFAATLLLSLKSRVEGNWAVAAYVTGMILAAAMIGRQWRKPIARAWHALSLALAAALTVVVLFPNIGYALGLRLANDRTNELYGWREMANRVEPLVQELGGPGKCFVFGVNYRMPSELAFYLPGHPQTYSLFLHDRANEYLFWENERHLIGKNAVYADDSATPDHLADCRAVFARVAPQPPLLVYRRPYKSPIRVIQIYACYDFKGYDRRAWQRGW